MDSKNKELSGNSKRIKEIRKQLGLTQKQFAVDYKIPQGTLENWEQGLSSPPDYLIFLMDKLMESEVFDGRSKKK